MLNFNIETARKAGKFLSSVRIDSLEIEHKGRIDLVTNADKSSQEIIIHEIERKFPTHAIVAEEGVSRKGTDGYVWYIDPIDGTTNFVHGVPIYCVSIALYKNNMPINGVCYNPTTDEMFYASKGKGAYLNGRQIKVSQTKNMVDALAVTGFPYKSDNMNVIMELFFKVVSEVQGIRRLGSAALDLCYVACGRFDLFWEMMLKPWDMAAGVLILEEAGGLVTNTDGSAFDLDRGNICASNQFLHDEILKVLNL